MHSLPLLLLPVVLRCIGLLGAMPWPVLSCALLSTRSHAPQDKDETVNFTARCYPRLNPATANTDGCVEGLPLRQTKGRDVERQDA